MAYPTITSLRQVTAEPSLTTTYVGGMTVTLVVLTGIVLTGIVLAALAARMVFRTVWGRS